MLNKLKEAFLKGLFTVTAICCGIAIVCLCIYLTEIAFKISMFLGAFALFVDAVLVATVFFFGEKRKSTNNSRPT